MAVLALVLFVAWIVVVAAVPTIARAGRPSRRSSFRDRPGSAQWWARMLSTVGLLSGLAAPIADLAGFPPIGALDHAAVVVVGLILCGLGVAVALMAQAAMGASWRGRRRPRRPDRAGDHGAVPDRPQSHPGSTALTALGLALLVPNLLSLVMLAMVLAAHQIQVRLVEEPYLLRVHGDAYQRYRRQTGRFVPWFGRWTATPPAGSDD